MMYRNPFNKTLTARLAPLVMLLGMAVAAPACAPPASSSDVASPAAAAADAGEDLLPLWELTHEGSTVYLLGSVHLLKPDVYPLDEAIDDAFDEAELIALEVDFDELMQAGPMMMQRGRYDDGRTLQDVLPADLHAQLEARVAGTPMQLEVVEQMKPWMASIMLSALVLEEAGFTAAAGIDLHFHGRAKEAGIEIIGLETVEEQLDVFDTLGEDAQVVFLRSTLDQIDDAAAQMDEATASWLRGDADALAEMMVEQMGDQPELIDRLLHARNRNWVPEIEALLETPETAMVIVGVGHLAGPGSVIDLLRQQGYEVTQVRSGSAVGAGAG